MTVPANDRAVEIRDVTRKHGRMLIVDEPHIGAVHFPASLLRSEEWRIVVGGVTGAELPPVTVSSEQHARAWLEFLARNLARGEAVTS